MTIQSAIQTKKGVIIVYKDKALKKKYEDGIDISITGDTSLQGAVNNLVWRVYIGKDKEHRKQEDFTYIRLVDMESVHLEQVWKSRSASSLHKWAIECILKDRKYWPKRFKN